MPPEQKQLEQIEGRLTSHGFYNGSTYEAQQDIQFLLSLVKSQEAGDDGSTDWCDDCHGYTHKYDCPSKRRDAKTPLVERIVDSVYRSMARYEGGEWWLDTLKAKARVKRLLAEPDAATSTCVEKVKAYFSQFPCTCSGKQKLGDHFAVCPIVIRAQLIATMEKEDGR